MRTSNKIILGIFLVPLLIITCINITLYAKYKSGDYVIMKTVREDRFVRYTLQHISRVKLSGLDNINIIPSDSLKLELEKGDANLIYKVVGDSLLVQGDTKNNNGKVEEISRSYNRVNLYLPSTATITAYNTAISLSGTKDSVKAATYQFSLAQNASFKIDQGGEDTSRIYFRNLSIRADHAASVELTGKTWIAGLALTTIATEFTDNGAYINKLDLNADDQSSITLKGENLKRMNTVH